MGGMASSSDRRKRKRVALHWPVRLFGQPPTPAVATMTKNLSSEGFFCIIKEPFKLGARLQCEIVIPGGSLGLSESSIRLQCHVTVKRVELLSSGFGLGCHIEDYSLLTDSPEP
jgi:hypothetical protein